MQLHPAHRRDRTSSRLVDQPSRVHLVGAGGASRRRSRSWRSKRSSGSPRRATRWEDLVGIYTQVLEERGDDAETQRHVLSRLARVYENELRDNARADEAHLQVLSIDPTDADALAALDRIYDSGRHVARAGRHPAPPHRRHHRPPTRSSSCTSASAASTPTRSTTRPRRSRLQRRPRATTRATGARSRRSSGSTSNASSGRSCSTIYEKMVDIAPGDDGMADCYARMAQDRAATALSDREQGDRPVGPRHRHPRRGSDRARRAGGPARARRAVARARRHPRAARCASRTSPQEQIPLYQRLGRIWGEKLQPRAQLARGVAEGPRDRSDRHPGAARAGGGLQARRRRGTSWSRRCTS